MKSGLLGLALLPLAACVATDAQEVPVIGMANPASVYCGDLGGRSVIKTGLNGGQTGYCHLPNGTVMEEWELFNAKI